MSRTTRILTRLVGFLPKRFQPAAKAIIPGTVGLVGVLTEAAASGHFDEASVRASAGVIVLALVTYVFPNLKPAAQ